MTAFSFARRTCAPRALASLATLCLAQATLAQTLPSVTVTTTPETATGPVQGSCEGLDAWECSRHDDCLATYSPDIGFQQCAPELVPECPPNTDCG